MRKNWLRVLGLTAAALYGWLAVQVYRADRDPGGRHGLAAIGPRAEALDRAVEAEASKALAALADPALPAQERVARYRQGLTTVQSLLSRSLAIAPGRAGTLARLAAVEWELDPDASETRIEERMALVRRAASLAPTSPALHIDLGRLLLSMGHAEALTYLSRAIVLEPATAPSVVEILREHSFTARAMLEALPREWRVLVALAPLFAGEAERGVFLEELEAELERGVHPPKLLDVYGDVCLHGGEAGRLLATLDRLGPFDDAAAEAERLRTRSRGHLVRYETERALEDARAARELRPDEPELANHLGSVLATAGEHESAIRAYRDVLGLLARREAGPAARAAIYSRIGRAEEQRARAAQAYDAYSMALRLDPTEPWAARRVVEMKRAAGLR